MKQEIDPVFFATQAGFRKWLEQHHDKKTELFVGFYKVGSGKPSMTWSQSVDEAICYGWIDGVRKRIDQDSYFIRFTPRKSNSIWSRINIEKVKRLTKLGLMKPSGLASFKLREEKKSLVYSYEKEEARLSPSFMKKFKTRKKAWNYFQSLPPSYRRTAIHWVVSAKQEITINKRLEILIADSEAGRKIKPLSYGKQTKNSRS